MSVNTVELFLKQFMVAWQIARIYELEHPKFAQALEQAYGSLAAILDTQGELIVGVFGDELASRDDIFFDLSKRVIASIEYLKLIEVEKITFSSGLSEQELTGFIKFLMIPPEQMDRPAQDYLELAGIEHIKVGKLTGSEASVSGARSTSEIKLAHYQACLENTAQTFEMLLENNEVDLLRLQFVSNDILKRLMGDHRIFLELAKVKGHDTATFAHLLNVSILSVHLAYRLGFGREQCLSIGLAALFHDIGKLFISKKILQKPGQLNMNEFSKVKSHTVIGAELLLAHKDIMTTLPAVVAFEHHREFDGSGYPKVSFSVQPHIAAFIVGICDVYDAFASRRTYKAAYPPEIIYELMMKQKGRRFHPELLEAFFKVVGVWPRASVVELSDGRIAIVRQINEDDIFSPQVEVVSEEPRVHIDLSRNKDIKIKRSLNTLNEGRQYLDLL